MADETIIVTPATTQALAFATKGDTGNTDENFCKTFRLERRRRRRRLEDSVSAARELARIADASGDEHVGGGLDARVEDGASRAHRVGEDSVGRDFVAMSVVEHDGGRVAIGGAREQIALDRLGQ